MADGPGGGGGRRRLAAIRLDRPRPLPRREASVVAGGDAMLGLHLYAGGDVVSVPSGISSRSGDSSCHRHSAASRQFGLATRNPDGRCAASTRPSRRRPYGSLSRRIGGTMGGAERTRLDAVEISDAPRRADLFPPFTSAMQAQVWMEWQRNGKMLPLFVGAGRAFSRDSLCGVRVCPRPRVRFLWEWVRSWPLRWLAWNCWYFLSRSCAPEAVGCCCNRTETLRAVTGDATVPLPNSVRSPAPTMVVAKLRMAALTRLPAGWSWRSIWGCGCYNLRQEGSRNAPLGLLLLQHATPRMVVLAAAAFRLRARPLWVVRSPPSASRFRGANGSSPCTKSLFRPVWSVPLSGWVHDPRASARIDTVAAAAAPYLLSVAVAGKALLAPAACRAVRQRRLVRALPWFAAPLYGASRYASLPRGSVLLPDGDRAAEVDYRVRNLDSPGDTASSGPTCAVLEPDAITRYLSSPPGAAQSARTCTGRDGSVSVCARFRCVLYQTDAARSNGGDARRTVENAPYSGRGRVGAPPGWAISRTVNRKHFLKLAVGATAVSQLPQAGAERTPSDSAAGRKARRPSACEGLLSRRFHRGAESRRRRSIGTSIRGVVSSIGSTPAASTRSSSPQCWSSTVSRPPISNAGKSPTAYEYSATRTPSACSSAIFLSNTVMS